jgi:hypothetical protein
MTEALDDKVSTLEVTSARLLLMQEQTTKNVDRLTEDIKASMLNATSIALMQQDIEMLKTSKSSQTKVMYAILTALILGVLSSVFKISL